MKTIDKYIFSLIILLAGMMGGKTYAQGWSVNPNDYHYDMSLYLDCTIGSGVTDITDYKFAAFVGDECRGVGEFMIQVPDVVYIRVYSNEASDETVMLKAYDSATQTIYDSASGIPFENLGIQGTPSKPYKVNFIVNPTELTLSKSDLSLIIGETSTLITTVAPDFASDKSVVWSSSKTSVATVSEGVVKAVAKGNAVITATCGNVSATCNVTVVTPPVESISLDKTTASVVEGDKLQLTASLTPDLAESSLTWKSSKPSVATVDATGLVEALSPGTAVISVETENGKSATCEITVTAKYIAVTKVSLNNTEISLVEDEQFTLTATVEPTNATDPSITWSSSNTDIATVSASGVVKAVKAGTAIITAQGADGKSATCSVTVTAKYIAVTKVSLNKTEISLVEDEQFTLTATVEPTNATDPSITWSSSNPEVATVENGVVAAITEGEAIITAGVTDEVSATCKVIVTAKLIPVIYVDRIELEPTEVTEEEGTEFTLIATVYPEDATNPEVEWESSDEEIVTVSENGECKILKAGVAVITVTATDGSDVSAECIVTGTSGVESLFADPDTTLTVYTFDGILVAKDCKAADLKLLGKGIYIVKSGNRSYRIVLQ